MFFISYFIIINIQRKKEYLDCVRLHNQKQNMTYVFLRKFISKKECSLIIQESIDFAKIYGWKTKRHSDYATTDNEITQLWKSYSILQPYIEQLKYMLSIHLKVNKNIILVKEIFVAKYEPMKQHYLDEHVDGSDFSFILYLNEDFEGGGTQFHFDKEPLVAKTGDCVLFPGRVKHRGISVRKGIRYIVVGFLHYKNNLFCEAVNLLY